MKIVHVTYARVKHCTDPGAWLKHLRFFTGIPDQMSAETDVESIHLIDYAGTLRRGNVLYHFLKISPFEWLVPFRLSRYISSRRPDAVVIHGIAFPWQILWLLFTLERPIKIFAQHHAERPFRFPKNILQSIVDHRISAYFFSAADLAKSWIASNQIRGHQKIVEVAELSSSFYSPEKERRTVDPHEYLWVGRLDKNKDPITLVTGFLEFIQREPSAVLRVVYRDGHLLDSVRQLLARSYTSRIILEAAVDHQQIEQWYDRSAFIISTSHYESMGAAVCEGMSCGCIPILTNIPSFRTMTNHGSVGFLFNAGEAHSLASVLVQSTRIDLVKERQKVFDQFRSSLSFHAIANKMMEAIKNN